MLDRSVPVEPSGSRLRQPDPPTRAARHSSSVGGPRYRRTRHYEHNLRRALGAEENQHSMTTFSTRWSHGPSSTRRNRDVHRQEVTR